MTQEAAPPAAQPEAAAQPAPSTRLERWADRFRPRTWKHKALYVSLFILFLFTLFVWRTSDSFTATVIVTPAEDNAVGIGPPTDDLDFGELSAGGAGTKALTIQNTGRIPNRMFVIPVGGIRKFIRLDDAFFLLKPGEAQVVQVSAVIPSTASEQEYSGRVIVIRVPWLPWP